MKKNIRIIALITVLALALVSLVACKEPAGTEKAPETIKIGLTGSIYEELWNPVKETLAKEGINIELVQFTAFNLPNAALDSGEIQLNAFQHHAYFENEKSTFGYKLTDISDTIVIAMNLYSDKIENVDSIKDGDTILIPNDATNKGRALKLLASAGLLTLDTEIALPDVANITSKKVDFTLVEQDASTIPQSVSDPKVAAAVVNGNYGLSFGLDPDYCIFKETEYADNSYFCLIAVREQDKDNETYKRIVEVFCSETTKQICEGKLGGFFVPVWDK